MSAPHADFRPAQLAPNPAPLTTTYGSAEQQAEAVLRAALAALEVVHRYPHVDSGVSDAAHQAAQDLNVAILAWRTSNRGGA